MPKTRTTTTTTTVTKITWTQEELKKILGLPERASLYWDEEDVRGPYELIAVIDEETTEVK